MQAKEDNFYQVILLLENQDVYYLPRLLKSKLNWKYDNETP